MKNTLEKCALVIRNFLRTVKLKDPDCLAMDLEYYFIS